MRLQAVFLMGTIGALLAGCSATGDVGGASAQAGDVVRLQCRAGAGDACTAVPVASPRSWQRLLTSDPGIPKTFEQLSDYQRVLAERRELEPGDAGFEECGEASHQRLVLGLTNPELSGPQRDIVAAAANAELPSFEHRHETEHFVLWWTNQSTHEKDNIPDSSIVEETALYMEAAWDTYVRTFGRQPYLPEGADKMEVIFYDISGFGRASPPQGPIQLDAYHFVDKPGIRQPTSAHELFHKLQYAYGYRTKHKPISPYKWFSEGTATWAEVYIWQRVSRGAKVTRIFDEPDRPLYDASYYAVPFWLYYHHELDVDQKDPMVAYFESYDEIGYEEDVLASRIGADWTSSEAEPSVDNFFSTFSMARVHGDWRSPALQPILGRDDIDVSDPHVFMNEVELTRDAAFSQTDSVSQLGSDYYRFGFDPEDDGNMIHLAIEGAPDGDFAYYLAWEWDGHIIAKSFPFWLDNQLTWSTPFRPGYVDAMVVIVSGRDIGGDYTIRASMD
ncbi:MAG: hypothetical protein MJE77_04945 [Proteobacteria bacterium]|nr:hypothetical protein [Pseudomonadota bacterium]